MRPVSHAWHLLADANEFDGDAELIDNGHDHAACGARLLPSVLCCNAARIQAPTAHEKCTFGCAVEFGEDDAYVQQQLPIVEDLLRQAAEKEKSENVSVSSASQQQAKRVAEQLAGVEDESRRNAIMEQAELNQRGLDEDGDKKKW